MYTLDRAGKVAMTGRGDIATASAVIGALARNDKVAGLDAGQRGDFRRIVPVASVTTYVLDILVTKVTKQNIKLVGGFERLAKDKSLQIRPGGFLVKKGAALTVMHSINTRR